MHQINHQTGKRPVHWLRHVFTLTALVGLTACSRQSISNNAPPSAPPPQPTSAPTPLLPSPIPPTPQPTSGPASSSPSPIPPTPQTHVASPTPMCVDHTLTPSQTEGPYFKAGSPERTSLTDAGIVGTKLVLTGFVMTTDCQPVAHALLDFWQANAAGQYDNSGYKLRGHQFTDGAGHYQLTTIVPGLYPGRTEHIHVKVQAPNGPTLTTQLYFPGVSSNQTDGIFDPKLVMTVLDTADGMAATFNFVARIK